MVWIVSTESLVLFMLDILSESSPIEACGCDDCGCDDDLGGGGGCCCCCCVAEEDDCTLLYTALFSDNETDPPCSSTIVDVDPFPPTPIFIFMDSLLL